ncbi:MAG: hypothetical protein FWE63_06315 [Bacteroidales bacterium]|nr:hypothetical protein [Bacteroidales bacterium]
MKKTIVNLVVVACLAGVVYSCDTLKGMATAGQQTVCNGNPCIKDSYWQVEIISVKGKKGGTGVTVEADITMLGNRHKNGDARRPSQFGAQTEAMQGGIRSTTGAGNDINMQRNVTSRITWEGLNQLTVSQGATTIRSLKITDNRNSFEANFTNIPITWE